MACLSGRKMPIEPGAERNLVLAGVRQIPAYTRNNSQGWFSMRQMDSRSSWQSHNPCGRIAASMALLFACTVFLPVDKAFADAKDQLTGQGGLPVPLQRVVRVERPKGPIFLAVPSAYVFGLGGERGQTYCSPTIRATNSSNQSIEELIVGIDFHTKAGSAGGSISRFLNIKVGSQDAHYFYQLTVADCRGVEGTVEVLRCKYTTGEDCVEAIQVIGFGTIPLKKR